MNYEDTEQRYPLNLDLICNEEEMRARNTDTPLFRLNRHTEK